MIPAKNRNFGLYCFIKLTPDDASKQNSYKMFYFYDY